MTGAVAAIHGVRNSSATDNAAAAGRASKVVTVLGGDLGRHREVERLTFPGAPTFPSV